MALQLNLSAQNNHMGIDFPSSYWQLQALHYDTENVYFNLQAYPNRESCHKRGEFIQSRLPIGGPIQGSFQPQLYCWEGMGSTAEVFPNGIPLSINEQKTAVYTYIKDYMTKYTDLVFEDVLED